MEHVKKLAFLVDASAKGGGPYNCKGLSVKNMDIFPNIFLKYKNFAFFPLEPISFVFLFKSSISGLSCFKNIHLYIFDVLPKTFKILFYGFPEEYREEQNKQT